MKDGVAAENVLSRDGLLVSESVRLAVCETDSVTVCVVVSDADLTERVTSLD